MQKVKKKIFIILMAFMLVLTQALSRPYLSFAEEDKYPFDKVDIMTDLSSIEGFDFGLYQTLDQGGISLLNFVEFSYSPYYVTNYALYVYIFNGMLFDISVNSYSNTIEFVTEYDTNNNAVTFETFRLIFCNKSDNGLFYKFRVNDSEDSKGNTFYHRVNSDKRVYDFSSIDLVLGNDTNATAFDVGGHFEFTGFGNSLSCEKSSSIETIELNVNRTYYRTESSWKSSTNKENFQTDVNSVYFSIPNYYLEQFGSLQKIKATWYEYATSPIIVCNDESKYNALLSKLGVDIGDYYSENEDSLRFDNYFYSFYDFNYIPQTYIHYGITYNYKPESYLTIEDKEFSVIDYLFLTDKDLKSVDWRDNVLVSSSELEDYIRAYSKDSAETLKIDSGSLCADLFNDKYVKYLLGGKFDLRENVSHYEDDSHHKIVEFDYGDSFDLLSRTESMTVWDNFRNWIFNIFGSSDGYSTEQSQYDNKYILYDTEDKQEIKNVLDTSTNISQDLLINANDVESFKSFYNNSSENDETTVLFRFAVSDYYANRSVDKNYLLSFETCFFDFDVISLTFSQDGVYKVIPVTSSPIEVINDITPDTQFVIHSIWERILAWAIYILAVIVAVIVAFVIVKAVIKAFTIDNVFVRCLCLFLLALFLTGLAYLSIVYVLPWLSDTIAFLGGL